MRKHDGRALDDSFSSLDGGLGTPGKRTRSEGLAGGHGGGAPILQFKPAGGGGDVHAGEDFLDGLLGHNEAKGEDADKKPDWMDPESGVPLPGEPVPGFGPGHKYTAADKDKLRLAYKARHRANHAAVGKFLHEYVDAAVSIMAKYVKGAVKEKDQVSAMLKFIAAEGLASMAGAIGFKIGKVGLEFLASKVTDFGISDKLEDDETFDDEKNQEALIATISASTGTLVEETVTKMEDGFDAGMWLGAAKVEQLHRFRIPELFVSPTREKIRGTVAGMVGGAHHRRVIGANWRDPMKWLEVNDVQDNDHNVVVVHVGVDSMGKAHVKSARINSRNKELAKEIDGKVDIGTLERMALHVTLDKGNDRLNPSAQIMRAMTRGEATPDDVMDFEAAYPKDGQTFSYTRNTKKAFATEGDGSMADHLLLYQMATGDHDLRTLADRFNPMEEDPVERKSRPGRQEPKALARSAYMAFKSTESMTVAAHALQVAVVDKATTRS